MKKLLQYYYLMKLSKMMLLLNPSTSVCIEEVNVFNDVVESDEEINPNEVNPAGK